MKKIIALTAVLLLTTAAFSQVRDKRLRFTVQAGESICFTRTGYYTGYETVQSFVHAQLECGHIIAGVGYDFPNDGSGTGDASLRLGYTLSTTSGRFGGEAFAAFQRGVGRSEGKATLAGAGISLYLRIAGPVHLVAEARTLYPFFNGGYYRYSYYRPGMVSYLALGVAAKF